MPYMVHYPTRSVKVDGTNGSGEKASFRYKLLSSLIFLASSLLQYILYDGIVGTVLDTGTLSFCHEMRI